MPPRPSFEYTDTHSGDVKVSPGAKGQDSWFGWKPMDTRVNPCEPFSILAAKEPV